MLLLNREGNLKVKKTDMKINNEITRGMLQNHLNSCEADMIENGVRLFASRQTDFICKYDEYVKDSAAFFFEDVEGDFTFSARVETQGNFDYDAAFLMVRQDDRKWIKLAVERGIDARYNVVSVITDQWSDDANGERLTSGQCWLRITRKGNYWGLHYSLNGSSWRFVRAFGLAMEARVAVGFGIQSPVGDQCTGLITGVKLVAGYVPDFRNGC